MRNQIKIVMGNKPSVAELKNSLDNQYKVLLRNKFTTRFFASVACACALLCIDHSIKHNECMDKYNTTTTKLQANKSVYQRPTGRRIHRVSKILPR